MQAQILLHVIGKDALDIFNSFQIEDENLKLSTVVAKFEAYFIPTNNITYKRYKLFSCDQKSGISFDQYLAELYVLCKSCEFQDLRDSLIRDHIVCGIADNGLRERLLREKNLTLDRTIDLCRAAQSSCVQVKELSKSEIAVHAV